MVNAEAAAPVSTLEFELAPHEARALRDTAEAEGVSVENFLRTAARELLAGSQLLAA